MSHHAAVSQQGGHRPPLHQASRYENPAAGEDASSVLGRVPVSGGAGRGLGPDPERAALHIPTRRAPRNRLGWSLSLSLVRSCRKRLRLLECSALPSSAQTPVRARAKSPGHDATAACRPGLPPPQFQDSSGRPSIPEGTGRPALARKGAQPWCPQLPHLGQLGDHAQVRRLQKPAPFPLK